MRQPTTARGARAAVASGHKLATDAAMAVLAEGGNLVDAGIAASLMLAVACPHACGLGGDVYLLIHDAKSGRTYGLNGTGRAPTGATPEAFADGIPRQGIRSATVPGLVAALEDARARFGTRAMTELARPAIRAAAEGMPVDAVLAANSRDRAELLRRDPVASGLFLPGGRPLAAGDMLRQPDLAEALEEIAGRGARAFYDGALGRRLAAGIAAGGGLVAADDLARHRSLWQEPLVAPYRGHQVATMPPNSYGLTLLLQLLELDRGGIGRHAQGSAEFMLAGLAARRRAYAAARGVIGDPERLEAPARALLAGAIAGDAPPAGRPGPAGGGCTTNFVGIDAEGNAVSLITSISAPFGSGVVVPGTGILLNNRMGGFVLDADSANRVAPHKRPAHTLAPCLVLRDGRPWLSLGTPGAAGQTATLAQILVRVLAMGQGWADAIAAPRWSVDLQGGFILEDTVPEALCAEMCAREKLAGVKPPGFQTFGSIKAAGRDERGVWAVADGRRAATAAAA